MPWKTVFGIRGRRFMKLNLKFSFRFIGLLCCFVFITNTAVPVVNTSFSYRRTKSIQLVSSSTSDEEFDRLRNTLVHSGEQITDETFTDMNSFNGQQEQVLVYFDFSNFN